VPLPEQVPADLLGPPRRHRRRALARRGRHRRRRRGEGAVLSEHQPRSRSRACSTLGLDRLLDAGSRQYGIGPAIRLPIFDSGRLRANLSGRTADLDAAIASYNGSVVDAVHDVADQISSTRSLERQLREQADAVAFRRARLRRRDAALPRRPRDLPHRCSAPRPTCSRSAASASTFAPARSTPRCCWCAPSAAATSRRRRVVLSAAPTLSGEPSR
jgi:hypothetical protein